MTRRGQTRQGNTRQSSHRSETRQQRDMEHAFRRIEDGEQTHRWDGGSNRHWGGQPGHERTSQGHGSRQQRWSSQDEEGRWGSRSEGDRGRWEQPPGTRQGGPYGWPDQQGWQANQQWGSQDPHWSRSQHGPQHAPWDGRERGDRERPFEDANEFGGWDEHGNGGGGRSTGAQRDWSREFGSEPWRSMSPNPGAREYYRSAWSGFGENSHSNAGGSNASGRGKAPKGYRRSDERIREEIAESVMEWSEIDASEVQIDVSNGNVTLQGTVDSRRTKNLLEEIADCVSGVEDIDNQIKVKRGSQDSRDSSTSGGSNSSSLSSASGYGSDASKTASTRDSGRTPPVAGRTGGAGSA